MSTLSGERAAGEAYGGGALSGLIGVEFDLVVPSDAAAVLLEPTDALPDLVGSFLGARFGESFGELGERVLEAFGEALWRRDFGGAASLFGVVLDTADQAAIARMVDGLTLFRIGSSWGGYESLVSLHAMPLPRDVVPWTEAPYLMRLHIGLEDPEDLMADLDAGLRRLRNTNLGA